MYANDPIRFHVRGTPGDLRTAVDPRLSVAILGHLAVVHDAEHRIAAVAVVSPAGDCAAVSRAGEP